MTDLVRVRPHEEEVEGDGGHQVDDEPPSEVVHGDLGREGDHLVVLRHVRRAEVDQDVDDEHDVHYREVEMRGGGGEMLKNFQKILSAET